MLVTCLALVVLLSVPACRSQPSPESMVSGPHQRVLQMQELADEAMADGEPDRAADLYLRAFDHARRVDDPGLQIATAERTARALIAAGRAREVLPILDEAEIAATRRRLPHAELTLLRAATELRDGMAEVARERLEPLVQNREPTTADQWLDALTLSAHAELDLGRVHEAYGLWQVAIEQAAAIATPGAAARTLRLEGRMAYATSQLALAANAYDLEAQRWQEAGAYLPMAQALARAANVYAEDQRPELAADRALRAGLSLRSQRQDGAAAESLHLALAAAREADDATREQLASRALAEVRERIHTTAEAASGALPDMEFGEAAAEPVEDQSARAE